MSIDTGELVVRKMSDGKVMIVDHKEHHTIVSFVDGDNVMHFDFNYNSLSDIDLITDTLIPIAVDLTIDGREYE